MGFAVVQWVGENSISVINENQATDETIEKGATVSVTSKTPKGKSVVYKALVLNVFGKYAYFSNWNTLKMKKTRLTVDNTIDICSKFQLISGSWRLKRYLA